MKKILKNRLFIFIITAIVFVSIGATASTLFASNITYDNTTSGLKDANDQDVTTVQGAIDSLYTKVNNLNNITQSFIVNGQKNMIIQLTYSNDIKNKYKYFSVTKTANSNATCVAEIRDIDTKIGDIVDNTKYPLVNNNTSQYRIYFANSSSNGWCTFSLKYSN